MSKLVNFVGHRRAEVILRAGHKEESMTSLRRKYGFLKISLRKELLVYKAKHKALGAHKWAFSLSFTEDRGVTREGREDALSCGWLCFVDSLSLGKWRYE